jgi:hypothetical protein
MIYEQLHLLFSPFSSVKFHETNEKERQSFPQNGAHITFNNR